MVANPEPSSTIPTMNRGRRLVSVVSSVGAGGLLISVPCARDQSRRAVTATPAFSRLATQVLAMLPSNSMRKKPAATEPAAAPRVFNP